MLCAGEEIAECYRVLTKAGLNIVGEILKGQGQFYQLNHCPSGDVYGRETHSQYYYHAHRTGEHGHFHTFLRQAGMPADAALFRRPRAGTGRAARTHNRTSSPSRWIAMDTRSGLFTTNRWVTDEICEGRNVLADRAGATWRSAAPLRSSFRLW
ncbi:DUF6969 family protein [Nitratireductor thuwali]|uniref:DUF6969 family protein n=1 Tax=Nitratireductor thuwali TaxID=2267699 RepID=UPI003BB0616A